MKFVNKTVIITGGGSGIGKKAAELFVKFGANVIINGRNDKKLQTAVNDIDPSGKKVSYVSGDISLPDTSKKLVKKAIELFGSVDILVNNTGKFVPTDFLNYQPDDIQSYLDTIVKGTVYPSQAVIPEMKKAGKGVIINTGSMWALNPVEATPSAIYSAAMAARHALTKNMALEFAKDQIRVNAVAPSVVETPIYNNFLSKDEVSKVLNSFNDFHPLGRNGQPIDVANAILFLASDESAWTTGVILPVDGGVTSRIR
ncbi:SDR family NAD(P)-dependent oxidoreductase [Apilactobacillus xinyiensis]|uniref:SDR family NAD(P)-dependent oxidoreductase n=1 Tax=Apilactobacillus xinyiensis TaxID=2841032 RepID=UPI001C7CCE4C|nr:SDR family oxidoreductase [Apilactobacillus xinyiensis]